MIERYCVPLPSLSCGSWRYMTSPTSIPEVSISPGELYYQIPHNSKKKRRDIRGGIKKKKRQKDHVQPTTNIDGQPSPRRKWSPSGGQHQPQRGSDPIPPPPPPEDPRRRSYHRHRRRRHPPLVARRAPQPRKLQHRAPRQDAPRRTAAELPAAAAAVGGGE